MFEDIEDKKTWRCYTVVKSKDLESWAEPVSSPVCRAYCLTGGGLAPSLQPRASGAAILGLSGGCEIRTCSAHSAQCLTQAELR